MCRSPWLGEPVMLNCCSAIFLCRQNKRSRLVELQLETNCSQLFVVHTHWLLWHSKYKTTPTSIWPSLTLLLSLQHLLQSFPQQSCLPPVPSCSLASGLNNHRQYKGTSQTSWWAVSDCLQTRQQLTVGTVGANPGGRWGDGFCVSCPVHWVAAVRVLKYWVSSYILTLNRQIY